MRPCWSVNNKTAEGAFSSVILALICIFGYVSEAINSVSPFEYIIKVGIIVVPFVSIMLLTAFVCGRWYEIAADGMTIYYPLGITKKIHWNEFSEIALCKIHYAAWGTEHIVAIRCVIGEEKHGPKQALVGKEKWTRIGYEVFHFRKIISIYKTDERIAEFHHMCPLPIVDYRYLEDRS